MRAHGRLGGAVRAWQAQSVRTRQVQGTWHGRPEMSRPCRPRGEGHWQACGVITGQVQRGKAWQAHDVRARRAKVERTRRVSRARASKTRAVRVQQAPEVRVRQAQKGGRARPRLQGHEAFDVRAQLAQDVKTRQVQRGRAWQA